MIEDKLWPKFTPDMSHYDATMDQRKKLRHEMKIELTASLTKTLTESLRSSLTQSLRPTIGAELRDHVVQNVVAAVTTQTQVCMVGLEEVFMDLETKLQDKDILALAKVVRLLCC